MAATLQNRFLAPAIFLGMRSFGASAPLKDLLKRFGFTADQVVAAARKQLGA